MNLCHVTTPKKAKLYREYIYIQKPVRGFDTLQAAMARAIKTGRTVIHLVTGSQNQPKLSFNSSAFSCISFT